MKQLVSENVTDFDSREISVISSVLISAQEGVIGEYNVSVTVSKRQQLILFLFLLFSFASTG